MDFYHPVPTDSTPQTNKKNMDIQDLRVRDKKTTYLPQTGRLPPQPTVEFLLRHIDPKCLVMPAHQAYAKKSKKNLQNVTIYSH